MVYPIITKLSRVSHGSTVITYMEEEMSLSKFMFIWFKFQI